jgi:hypothetical protein
VLPSRTHGNEDGIEVIRPVIGGALGRDRGGGGTLAGGARRNREGRVWRLLTVFKRSRMSHCLPDLLGNKNA